MMVTVPLIIMFISSLMVTSGQLNPPNMEYTVGGKAGYSTSENAGEYYATFNPISVTTLLEIFTIVAIAVGICIALAIKVLGSGISGSVVPIVFATAILGGLYTILSGLSFGLFQSIPIFGLIIFVGLTVMFMAGLVGMAITSGGD
jgi:hypothetical protein